MGTYADQRGHDVTWMTAAEREALDKPARRGDRYDDGYDGVQYDTFYAPDPAQLEAEQIRRECADRA